MKKSKNNLDIHIGKIYNYLTVLTVDREKGKRTHFTCQCICGNIKSLNCQDVLQLHTKSCGCKRQELFKKAYDKNYNKRFPNPIENFLFSEYKLHGKKFELNFNDFVKLVNSNCYYCDSNPCNLRTTKNKKISKYFNGIDRVDNSEGYKLSNCVSCCSTCNYMKRNLTKEKFYSQIEKIFYNLQKLK